MSHAYDVANGMGLSAVLDRYGASERDLALRSMQAVYGLVGQLLPMLCPTVRTGFIEYITME